MLWTDNKITASNCKNNMEGYTYNIQHLTLPRGCINEQGNKRNLETISQEQKYIYTRLKQSTPISQSKVYPNSVLCSPIKININIAS